MSRSVHCLEFSRSTARLAVRERLAVRDDESSSLSMRVAAAFGESVVLSTCVRFEIYTAGAPQAHASLLPGAENVEHRHPERSEESYWMRGQMLRCAQHDVQQFPLSLVTRLISRALRLPPRFLASNVRIHRDRGAARHLFDVAAGLDSPIPGEDHVLGQVRDAFLHAQQIGTIGPILSAMFRGAIHTGKRVRSETDINRIPQTYGQLAAEAVQRSAGQANTIVLVGSGTVAREVAAAFSRVPETGLIFAGHHRARVLELASRFRGQAVGHEELPAVLRRADAVVACTKAARPVITMPMLSGVSRPLVIVDLGMPRNVEPQVADLPGIQLHSLDDLEPGRPAGTTVLRQAHAIVDEELRRFSRWLHARDRMISLDAPGRVVEIAVRRRTGSVTC